MRAQNLSSSEDPEDSESLAELLIGLIKEVEDKERELEAEESPELHKKEEAVDVPPPPSLPAGEQGLLSFPSPLNFPLLPQGAPLPPLLSGLPQLGPLAGSFPCLPPLATLQAIQNLGTFQVPTVLPPILLPSLPPPPSLSSFLKPEGEGCDVVDVHKQLLKTKVCKLFLSGKCKYGKKCFFAHTATELRLQPDLRKTTLCRLFPEGLCLKGEACRFAHGSKELRATDGVFKTVLCQWHLQGHCQHGDRCRFAHGDRELVPQKPQPTVVETLKKEMEREKEGGERGDTPPTSPETSEEEEEQLLVGLEELFSSPEAREESGVSSPPLSPLPIDEDKPSEGPPSPSPLN